MLRKRLLLIIRDWQQLSEVPSTKDRPRESNEGAHLAFADRAVVGTVGTACADKVAVGRNC